MRMELTPEEHFEIFGTEKIGELAEEAETRWRWSQALMQSRRRTAGHTKQDWVVMKRDADAAPGLARCVHDAIVANPDRADRPTE